MGKTIEHLGRVPFCTLGGRGPQPLFIILALAGDPRSSLEEGLPGFGRQSRTPVGVTDRKAEVQERPCVHIYTTPFPGLS